MRPISERQRVMLKLCRVATWEGVIEPLGNTAWATLMVVNDVGFAIGVLHPDSDPAEDLEARPDVIIWPKTPGSIPDWIPASCHTMSLIDVDGDITRLLSSTQPCAIWLDGSQDQEGALEADVRPSWQQRADQTIDLGDVLR